MNIFQHWKYFQRTDIDFLQLSFKKQYILPDLISLNERRQIIQSQIVKLSSENDTCKTCPTSCCRGNYNHFTMVDFIIRMFSDKPINEFAKTQLKPPSIFELILNKIQKYKIIPNVSRLTTLPVVSQPISASRSNCPNLTLNGCAFAAEDRPIRCVIYTCSSFRRSLKSNDFEKIGILSEELRLISSQSFKLFAK